MEQKNGPLLQVTGNHSVVLEGCDGVIDYDRDEVVLKSGRLVVHLCGANLKLRRLTSSCAVVTGELEAVIYTYS